MALKNLVWFGANRPEIFKVIKNKAHGRRSEFEYPFAWLASISLSIC